MKPPQHQSTPPTLDPSVPPPNNFSILIVDDSPENRRLFSRLLTTVGYRPIEAHNGTEAINQLVRRRPHLVLTDVEMPGMSGIQAVREIRRLPAGLSETPIIAGSGNPDPKLKRDILAAGADAYLPKPMDVGKLLETISALLQRSRGGYHSRRRAKLRSMKKLDSIGNAA